MARHIFKCPKCKRYTLEKECNFCKVTTESSKPPKYNPEDRFQKYRIKFKAENLKDEGLI